MRHSVDFARAGVERRRVIRVLLIGCGDIALRTADLLRGKVRLYGLTRRQEDIPKLRGAASCRSSAISIAIAASSACARRLLRCCISRRRRPKAATIRAPRSLIAALTKARIIPQRFVYISTSGVYGDCAGARVERDAAAQAADAARAEARRGRGPAAPLGAALRRQAFDPARARHLRRNAAAARPASGRERRCFGAEDDVFTNHIHADDLARAAVAAAFRGKPNRAYNVSDDAELQAWAAGSTRSPTHFACRGRRACRGTRPKRASRRCCFRS